MEKYKINDKQTKESAITPDPQIRALLGMIKTPEPPDEIRLNVMRLAKEKLQKRPLRQKLVGKVRLYFTKRRLGLEVNTSEKLMIYSLAVITICLITISGSAAYHQLSQPLMANQNASKPDFTNNSKLVNDTEDKTKISSSPKETTFPKNETTTTSNHPNKAIDNVKLTTKKAIRKQPSLTFTLPEDLTPSKKPKTHSEEIEKDSLAQNNLQIIDNPGINNSATRSKTDTSSTIPKTTIANEINEIADLASMKTIYVKDLGIDKWSVMLRNEMIVAIEESKQWHFAEKENADVAFRLNKKGELLLVNREGSILWLNSNLTNEKLTPKKAAQQVLKEVKEATKNFASKSINK